MQIYGTTTIISTALLAATLPALLFTSGLATAQPTPTCSFSDASDDPDFDGFVIEDGATCLLPPPPITNALTGETVNFKRAIWLPEDLAGTHDIYCEHFAYDSFDQVFRNLRQFVHTLNPEVNESCVMDGGESCGGDGTIYTLDFNSYTPYTLENGHFSWGPDWVDADFDIEEFGSLGVRELGYLTWDSDGEGYSRCAGIGPSGSVPEESVQACHDTDPVGDGWGWNGATSCRVAGATPTAGDCIDTLPVGDGWGWNGVSSCEIPLQQEAPAPCFDTDPIGDGWGWNGVTSCRISEADEAICVDWDGDGWGWDGTSSCIP